MHDWNVDPHMAVPTINRLIDAGIEARGLFASGTTTTPIAPFNLTIGRNLVVAVERRSQR